MKKVIFATNNPAKVKRFSEGLLSKKVEVKSLKDLNIKLDIVENGSTAIENALIKARACFKETGLPSIGMDDTLYLEGVPDSLQPGLFVRRVNGRELSDEEAILYYTNLVKTYGVDGRLNAKWVYGLVVINEFGKEEVYTWSKSDFYMVDVASSTINPGYPLNSISKYKSLDKYFTDVTKEELDSIKVNEDHVIDFIVNNI